MGFWDNVNEELKKAVGEGWTAVRDNARIGKLRLRISSLHKKADKHFSEIGGKVYEMYGEAGEVKPNPLESAGIIQLVEEINVIEAEVREIEAEIAAIRRKEEKDAGKETAAPAAAKPAETKPSEAKPGEGDDTGKDD
ncbi:MAG: hypothetical protein ACE5GY_02205 [Thermodesulfobacteriota bacterium]